MIHHLKNKLCAFTLAEVLVTLGIIGVVAALTMPMLIANYQKKVWVAQLKKDANFISNSIRRVLADEGIDNLCLSSLAECENSSGQTLAYIFGEEFGKYFNLAEIPDDTLFAQATDDLPSSGDDEKFRKAFYLNDGSCIATASSHSGYGITALGFFVDVNCDKKPNKWARDRFLVPYDKYGMISPGSSDDIQFVDTFCKTDETLGPLDFLAGTYCFYKIMRDGWEMNY